MKIQSGEKRVLHIIDILKKKYNVHQRKTTTYALTVVMN